MKKVTSLTLASLVTMSGLTAGFSAGTAHADTQNNEKYDSKAGKVETQTSKNDTSKPCLLYTSPSPRDVEESRMPSSA